MKYTILVTTRCNLRCRYCYIKKTNRVITIGLVERIIEFILNHTPENDRVEIGLFGGEPLLEFDMVKKIITLITDKIKSKFENTHVSIISNGTVFSEKIAQYIDRNNIGFGISCDGIPMAHNLNRTYKNGKSSSVVVEKNILWAINSLKKLFVNAVYQPTTIDYLPQTIEYFATLGIKQIYLNPDYSAEWTKEDILKIKTVYSSIAQLYMQYYLRGDPHFISLIDGKIAVILRGGYQPMERCRMGKGEFAFAPDGNIYPCERLVSANCSNHSIGSIKTSLDLNQVKCNIKSGAEINKECIVCSMKDYCMNWCGCSNFFATGYYNRVNAFICESEKSSIQIALQVLKTMSEKNDALFCDHLAGIPLTNSLQLSI